jgi:hypothetical protein
VKGRLRTLEETTTSRPPEPLVERRKALITAAIVSGAVFAASAAIGLNVGLLGSGADENPVGNLQADDLVSAESPAVTPTSAAEPVTVVVDEYVTEPAPAGIPSAGAGSTNEVWPSATSAVPSGDTPVDLAPPSGPGPSYDDDDDDHDDDGEHEDEDDDEDEDDEHEEEHEEYEGHDDDD